MLQNIFTYLKPTSIILSTLGWCSSYFWYNEVKHNHKYTIPISGVLINNSVILLVDTIYNKYYTNDTSDTLILCNYCLSIFHGILGYYICIKDVKNSFGEIIDISKYLPASFNFSYTLIPEIETNTNSDGNSNGGSNNSSVQIPKTVVISKRIFNKICMCINSIWNFAYLDIKLLLSLFFNIASAFHFFYAINIYNIYTDNIYKKNNYFRWIEYSMTATIMIILISRVIGISHKETITLISSKTISIMLLGWVIENCMNIYDSVKEYHELYNIHFQDIQDISRNTMIISIIIGFFLLFSIFKIIISIWRLSFRRITLTSNINHIEVPKILKYINYILYLEIFLFNCFGILQLIQVICTINDIEFKYQYVEYSYMILSLISKSFLGLGLFYSIKSYVKVRDLSGVDIIDDIEYSMEYEN